MPATKPPTPAQIELLRSVAGRKIPGPLMRTADRDRLRRMGFIVADQQASTLSTTGDGQARIWRITEAGESLLAQEGLL